VEFIIRIVSFEVITSIAKEFLGRGAYRECVLRLLGYAIEVMGTKAFD